MSLDEIESLFAGPVVILPDTTNSLDEQRLRAIGRTSVGRAAFVVFTMRHRGGGHLRPISARFMHAKEIRAYEEAYPQLRVR